MQTDINTQRGGKNSRRSKNMKTKVRAKKLERVNQKGPRKGEK